VTIPIVTERFGAGGIDDKEQRTMSITVLNNISSLIAENAVSNTQTNLQNTLQQLSTGLRINSGADDPAGLSIADGLGANISALTQSSQNATNGIGLLQTADGALSQVTDILNQAVSIATEASNGGLTTSQSTALDTQFQSILTEINQIGSTTNFNGTSIFGSSSEVSSDPTTITSASSALTATTKLTSGAVYTIGEGSGNTFSYTATANSTVGDLIAAFQGAEAGTTSGTDADGGTFTAKGNLTGELALNSNGNLTLSNSPTGTTLTSAADTKLGGVSSANNLLTPGSVTTITDGADTFTYTAAASGSTVQNLVNAINDAGSGVAYAGSGTVTGTLPTGTTASINTDGQLEVSGTNSVPTATTTDSVLGSFTSTGGTSSVFTSDGTTSGEYNLSTNIGGLSAQSLGLNTLNLSTTANAQAALTAISSAINTVAAQRGSIGASVNTLTSDSNVETTEVQNLTNAQNNVQNADIASVTSNMTQYNVLEQTGFDALSQANSAEQNVLKLLQ
jgi:flagellin